MRLQMLGLETLKWALLAQQTRHIAGHPLFFMGLWLLSRALYDGIRDTSRVSVRSIFRTSIRQHVVHGLPIPTRPIRVGQCS